ncbi:SNF2 family N-terminal domain-containing protein [Ampelomyces quisqualis]|uniref:SNF2 family N-terminal domain-containing protein n=1 Tax=Ampelomyces quisqualis TaxID=50730 RepID=A0A6A5QWQ5_AMPQU|nr:SNF2 family N-terminal domain-containing protein [Ampelomyces quisqualis]
MALFEGRAHVLRASRSTSELLSRDSPDLSLDAQDATSNLDSIHSLFAAPEAHTEAQRGAHKRRKLHHDGASINETQLDQCQSVVLASISLELSFPSLAHEQMQKSDSQQGSHLLASLVLSLEHFEKIDPSTFRAVVYNADTGRGTAIVATAAEDLVDSISPHLRTAATLSTSRNGIPSRRVARAAFVQCLLLPHITCRHTHTLSVTIHWALNLSVVEAASVATKHMKEDLKLLSRYFPAAAAQSDTPWTLSDFYEAVHVPPADLQVSPRLQQTFAETHLHPFQARAVDWLLRREGVAFSPAGSLESCVDDAPPASFRNTQDALGKDCHVSQLRGMVVTDLQLAEEDPLQSLRGGILAEEMGLGKTVELIALMTHHHRTITHDKLFDAYTGAYVTPSRATLIITPPSILEQWISEINTHAPELKVLHYRGLPPSSAPKEEHAATTLDNLMRYDVVLTTYNVLSKEIHYATPPPDRSLRKAKRHERRKSPLVEISWWRVCLDEAQMIESGVSQAAVVARIIPRCNAWAVSGTPLRKDVQDLRGLLIFLRCDALANNKAVWDRLDKGSFKSIFNQISLRHTKDKVRDQLLIPPQKRVTITVPFTTIEEQNYSDMVRQMCDACWLTPEGQPLGDERDANQREIIERMRDWLVRLRQTCLHAHVGRKNRRALGARNGALRTVHEVLEVMIEQNDANWKSESREMILQQIKLGHITAYAGNIINRAESALPYFKDALMVAQGYVRACRAELVAELKKIGKSPRAQMVSNGTALSSDGQDRDSEDEKDTEILGSIPIIRKALRSFLELEHACCFFIATTYHQMKENKLTTQHEDIELLEKHENDWYQTAKLIRRELLQESKTRAQRQMSNVSSRNPFHQIPQIDDLPEFGGIESRQIPNTMDNISDFLNAQADLIQSWRKKIVDILLLRLTDDDDDQEMTGEEYDESLKAQDELYVYIMALRTLIADRNATAHGLQDTLVEHELRAAEKQALQKDTEDKSESRGHAPELVIEIAQTRRKLQAMLEGGSLKGVVFGVRSLATALQWRANGGDARAAAEHAVVQKYLARIQTIYTQQAKTITELEKEQEIFRATMNQRLEYYRQFQHISDTVAKYKEELDDTFDAREFAKCEKLRQHKKDTIASLKTKHTYLTHLRAENQEEAKAECIICQDTIELGVLTTCGHKYCKVCINTWWQQHRTCPLCKQKLSSSDFKDINFKPTEMRAQEETQQLASPSQASTPGSWHNTIYSDISDSILKEIKMIDLEGSYGTKIDMIARHLLWIRAHNPGAKSIVFSQFGDFLEVLREAFKKWRIGVSGIRDKDGIQKFKTDASIDGFLLDAKSDSSGLNLVNATYVFLCEPLINPAIELQAIARVHRIGQQRTTTVFMYLISDTVEEAIYDISVARRLAHIGKHPTSASQSGTSTPKLQENTLDKANSAEMQAVPLKSLLRKKGNGEEVKEDDLWHCLFGKQRKMAAPVLEHDVDRFLRAEAADGRAGAGAAGRF